MKSEPANSAPLAEFRKHAVSDVLPALLEPTISENVSFSSCTGELLFLASAVVASSADDTCDCLGSMDASIIQMSLEDEILASTACTNDSSNTNRMISRTASAVIDSAHVCMQAHVASDNERTLRSEPRRSMVLPACRRVSCVSSRFVEYCGKRPISLPYLQI